MKGINNRGQIQGIMFFMVLVIAMIIIAPIILKVGLTILDTTSTKLGEIDSSNVSSENVAFVKGKITGTFDWIVLILIICNLLLLLVTSFLIDVHPAFVITYIVGVFVAVLTLPYAAALGEQLYSMSQFSGEGGVTQYLPMTEFLLRNFGAIMVGVIVLSGVVMYAKFKYGSQGGGTRGAY